MKHFFKTVLTEMFIVVLAGSIHAADVGTITESSVNIGPVRKVVLSWTTETNTCSASCSTNSYLRGELVRVSLLGTTATNAYDVTLIDSYGQDLLFGFGAAIPSNTLTTFTPGQPFYSPGLTNQAPVFVNDQPNLVVTNAGNGVSGTVILYLR